MGRPAKMSQKMLAISDGAPPVDDRLPEGRECERGHLEALPPERNADDGNGEDKASEAPGNRCDQTAKDDPDYVRDSRHQATQLDSGGKAVPSFLAPMVPAFTPIPKNPYVTPTRPLVEDLPWWTMVDSNLRAMCAPAFIESLERWEVPACFPLRKFAPP